MNRNRPQINADKYRVDYKDYLQLPGFCIIIIDAILYR